QDGAVVASYQRAETHCDPVKRRPSAPSSDNVGRAAAVDRDALVRLARSLARGCPGGLDGPAAVAREASGSAPRSTRLTAGMSRMHVARVSQPRVRCFSNSGNRTAQDLSYRCGRQASSKSRKVAQLWIESTFVH